MPPGPWAFAFLDRPCCRYEVSNLSVVAAHLILFTCGGCEVVEWLLTVPAPDQKCDIDGSSRA